jgi:hypothetical protein
MNRRTMLTAAVAALLGAIVAGTADAKIRTVVFKGTRDQVRAACAKSGGTLHEEPTATTCTKLSNPAAGVTCGNDGNCIGSGPARAAAGQPMWDQPGVLLGTTGN